MRSKSSSLRCGAVDARSARGAAKVGCAIAAVAIALVLLVGGGCVAGGYNALVGGQTKVEAAWSEIDNQYKRRYDLIPQLVETVKGAAEFEQTVLTDVTEARASVGRAQLPADLPTDPAQLEAYLRAQQGLSSALGRLFAVSENYPALRASEGFLSLQDQIEGTENRIATARRDYIEAVREYNTGIRSFPGNLFAGLFGFEEAAQITAGEAERERPEIDFNFDRK